jgi:hypothetical protein
MTDPEGIPGATAVAPGAAPPARDPDLALAHVHLRLGSLGLARAELETMAGRGALDDEGLRDLAEARWRTGDPGGAGEAAAAWLETRPDDILGLVIAAEAQAAAGRPGEARRLAGRALERADGSLDPIFAGMPRSTIWPIEPGTAAGPAGVLFDDLHPGPLPVGPRADDEPVAADAGAMPAGPLDGPSLWGDAPAKEAATDPAELVRGARASLDAGRPDDAAAGLLLALRASPSIAPAVLDLLAGRPEPILAIVRGDAARIVGHEVEAMRDHAAAGATLGERTRLPTADVDPSGDPAPTVAFDPDAALAAARTDPSTPDQEDS